MDAPHRPGRPAPVERRARACREDLPATPREPGLADLVACPECGGHAEVRDRFVVESTAGPVEHVRIGCVEARHHFTLPAARLCAPGSTTNQ